MTPQNTGCSEVLSGAFDTAAEGHRAVYVSGECEIDFSRRELRVLGSPVPLGGRAFEVIGALAQSAGELVTKAELMGRIWPGAIVMEATLHVHAAAVRKALGPYRGLLKTEAGRGYRLLGDWTVRRRDAAKPLAAPPRMRVTGEAPPTNIPAIVTSLVGRSAAVRKLHDLVSAYRVVTLTGPGGIGKTTLALQVARRVLGGFAEGGWLVELASLSDPRLVPSAVAGVLGLRLGSSNTNSAEAVARAIGGKRLLLVLDNCEHVIDAAAIMAEMFVRFCPRATILATSRELFRIEGEYAYRVPPLEVPAKDQTRVEEILSHSAPELFIARANELGSDFSLRPQTLPTIAEICRQLDGIPLAIELAAARAATLGIELVATGLRDRFALLKTARRGALPRHRTLRATLDWSFELLTDAERHLLQRLAIFSGSFPLEAVNAVINRGDASELEIADCVANLVAKSLVTSDLSAGGGYFRLLETTRLYASSKLIDSGELREYAQRHADYYKGLLERIENEWEKRSIPLAHVDNVRAALKWCFGLGNLATGVGLAAVAAPVFLAMSLLPECHSWSERAILALDDATRGGLEEMNLQASLAVSSMQISGQSDAAHVALSRALTIARAHGDVLNQVGLLGMLSMFEVRDGDFKRSLDYARLSRTVDGTVENSAATALANSILGRALQFVGEHGESRSELESSFHYWSRSQRTSEVFLGLDHQILVGIGLARNRWLQGYPAQALERVLQTIRDAERKEHPASLGLALSWAPEIFLWIGDLQRAREHSDWLLLHSESYSLRPYLAVARGYRGSVAIGRGNAATGVEDLRSCLDQLHAMRYRMLSTGFKLALVQGLMAIGLFGEAMTLINETISLVEANGDLVYLPEVLRVKGSLLLSLPRSRTDEAEMCFVQSLDWSRRQRARSWELRTATDLAALWVVQGQSERARAVLQAVVEEFVEGLDTANLTAANKLLTTLR